MKMIRPYLVFELLLLTVFLLPNASAIEILIPETKPGTQTHNTSQNTPWPSTVWTLKGDIEKGDFDKFIDAIRRTSRIPNAISLDSTGGDINEAINLGHFFRKALIGYHGVIDESGLPRESECSSACALIYFGAIRKLTRDNSLTRIGLHRPYFDRDYYARLTAEQASNQYQRAENTIRGYLQDMSVPSAVADVMFETESTSMSYFNDHELSEWLPASPVYQYDMISATHESILRDLGCEVDKAQASC